MMVKSPRGEVAPSEVAHPQVKLPHLQVMSPYTEVKSPHR